MTKIKIATTFNDEMYEFSGKKMLETVNKYIPNAEVVVYEELENHTMDIPTIKVNEILEFKKVFKDNVDVISPLYGGTAKKIRGEKFWNKRWFGWFRKVVMNFHAVCVDKYDGYLIFVDSDIRFTKGFDEGFLDEVTSGKPISYFRGDREAIDSGLVVVNNRSPKPRKFYTWFMQMFLSGEFKSLTRWDDGYVLTKLVEKCPREWFCDFAEGVKEQKHKNTNGHETVKQVIPFTKWGEYIEHDKGIHVRNKIL